MFDAGSKRAPAVIISVLALAGSFLLGMSFGGEKVSSSPPSDIISGVESPENVNFTPFWKVWNIINERYVSSATTTTNDERVWGAIQGLTASLNDPYTVFFPPEEKKNFESEISGNFEGVGMEIAIKDEIITVVAPLKGTPAFKAGIQPGDKILKIDEKVTADMRVDEAVRIIRGPKGTSVKLTILRKNKEPFEVKVVRDVIDVPVIDTEIRSSNGGVGGGLGLRGDGIFVIKLYNFTAPSKMLFRQALREFVLSGSHKLILDLRGNPGGYLDAAIDISSWFVPQGKVIVSEDFGKNAKERVHRSFGYGYNLLPDGFKMVVLVNGGSASASEIVAGALQEHKIATLVGEKTFGKGSVQELLSVTSDTSLKITVARWLTPEGRSISEGGLTTDIEVKGAEKKSETSPDPQFDKAVEILTKNQ